MADFTPLPVHPDSLSTQGVINAGGSAADRTAIIKVKAPEPSPSLTPQASYRYLTDAEWNEIAVRKVLQVFAYGGFASDAQIQAWADMPPVSAIAQMLTFDKVNLKLSPADLYDRLDLVDSTLIGISRHFSSGASRIPGDEKTRYRYSTLHSASRCWYKMMCLRGINPVRNRIGYWATNYHMAANFNASVSQDQLYDYYDMIMNALAADLSFDQVLAKAAVHSAMAVQYRHYRYRNYDFGNYFRPDGSWHGNENFGREFFQLFFGILGYSKAYTQEYHEKITIPQMARALSDIWLTYHDGANAGWDVKATYGTAGQFKGPLEILGAAVPGETAVDRVNVVAPRAIANDESLRNLPVRIVRFIADENMTPETAAGLADLWGRLPKKSLLDFLRHYAISTLFHNPRRVKYWNTIERNLLHTNMVTTSNYETYRDFYRVRDFIEAEGQKIFSLDHNVFGGQTGLDAANNSKTFKLSYDRAIERGYYYMRQKDGTGWRKDWGALVPGDSVVATTEWLWKRFIADGPSKMGLMERYHLYALVGAGVDLAWYVNPADPYHVFTESELAAGESGSSSALGRKLQALRNMATGLRSTNARTRAAANGKMGAAIAFLIALPQAFAQVGQ
ncbi:MAG TPA: DUF1800 family protein [Vineibacter sp.]|nr:DUF1800 family protein [Vineibacter sp.]